MSGEEYILKEAKLIENEVRDKGITPGEWISKNAESYQRKYMKNVIPACRPWFTYININNERG